MRQVSNFIMVIQNAMHADDLQLYCMTVKVKQRYSGSAWELRTRLHSTVCVYVLWIVCDCVFCGTGMPPGLRYVWIALHIMCRLVVDYV